MLYVAGSDDVQQWFTYRGGFFQPLLTVAWPRGTMQAVLPATAAEALVLKHYARPMTDDEVQRYNDALTPRRAPRAAPHQEEPEQQDALKPRGEPLQEEPEQQDTAESRPARRGRPRKGD